MGRNTLAPQRQELRRAVQQSSGWQWDIHTGDAYMIVRSTGGESPRVGVIAHVRSASDGFESVVTAYGGRISRYPYDGVKETAMEALAAVERWLQHGMEGIAADEATSAARQELGGHFREFLSAEFGEPRAAELWNKFLSRPSMSYELRDEIGGVTPQ